MRKNSNMSEMIEEIGIDAPFRKIFSLKCSDDFDNTFATVYLAISDKEIIPEKKEIAEIKWVTLDWLKKDMETSPDKYTYPFLEGMKVYWEKFGTKLP